MRYITYQTNLSNQSNECIHIWTTRFRIHQLPRSYAIKASWSGSSLAFIIISLHSTHRRQEFWPPRRIFFPTPGVLHYACTVDYVNAGVWAASSAFLNRGADTSLQNVYIQDGSSSEREKTKGRGWLSSRRRKNRLRRFNVYIQYNTLQCNRL